MAMNRSGVFFTLGTILFLSVLVLLFTSDFGSNRFISHADTVDSASAFRERLEAVYLPTVLEQRSYVALVTLSSRAQSDGEYLLLPADYQQLLLSGSYTGSVGGSKLVPSFQTLPQALDNLTAASLTLGFNITYSINSITIIQTGSFQGAYIANLSYNMSTKDNSVRYERNLILQNSFSLIGISDLYYNRHRPVSWGDNRTFQQFQPSVWNETTFFTFATNSSYARNNDSPSIFDRLRGNASGSTYGVETVIPVTVTPANNYTSIDWENFTNLQDDCRYNISSISTVRLDYQTIIDYNLTTASVFPPSSPIDCPAPPK